MLQYEFIDPDHQINSADFQFVESFLNFSFAAPGILVGTPNICNISHQYQYIKGYRTITSHTHKHVLSISVI